MKKIFLIICVLLAFTSYSQTLKKTYNPWLKVEDITVNRYFIWHGDTIDFDEIDTYADSISAEDNWLKVYKSGEIIDSVYWNYAQDIDIFDINGDSLRISLTDNGTHRINLADYILLKSVYDTAQVSEQVVGINSAQVLNNKTLVLPFIGNYTNAQHDHSSAAGGGQINTDNILEGVTNLWSQWLKSGSNIYRNGYVGIGKVPTAPLDVKGLAKTEQLLISGNLQMSGYSIDGIQGGTGPVTKIASKNYVDDAITASGGYSDEQAQDAIGLILDNDSIGDIDFYYDDDTPAISGTVQDDSHSHSGATISGLGVSDFTSPNVSQFTNDANYINNTFSLSGDLSGTLASPQVTDDSHNHVISNVDNLSDSLSAHRTVINYYLNDSVKLLHWSDTLNTTKGIATPYDLTTGLAGKEPTLTKGNLTENVTGLQFSQTRQVIGGSVELQLTSGYSIPATAHLTRTGNHVENDADTIIGNEYSIILKDGAAIGNRQKLDFQDSTGIAITATDDAGNGRVKVNIRNTAPDQTVVINEALGIDITGSYPNFTAKIDTADVSILSRQRAAHEYQPKGNYLSAEVDGSTTNELQNLTYQRYSDKGIMNISGGTGDTIPIVDADYAGLMTPEDKVKLDTITSHQPVTINPASADLASIGEDQVLTVSRQDLLPVAPQYGYLYNWLVTQEDVAPTGWHVPTIAEWETLFEYLGDEDGDNNSWPLVGGMLKEIGTTYWVAPNEGASNSTGFNAIGAGTRYIDGEFVWFKESTNYLSSTEYISNINYGWRAYLFSSNDESAIDTEEKAIGSSLRFIKDDSTDPGTVTDYDGNEYATVKIGDQVWMAQNFRGIHYNDGSPIDGPNFTDEQWAALTTPAYCIYQQTVEEKFADIDHNSTKNKDGGDPDNNYFGHVTAAQQQMIDTIGNYMTLVNDTLTAHNERLLTLEATLESSGDNWGTQTVVTDNTLSGNGTVASPLKADTTKLATPYDLIVGLDGKEPANGNIQTHISNDGDLSATNEIQDLSRTGNTLSLTGDGTTVDLSPYLDNTDSQTLSADSTSTTRGITISGGNRVHFSINDADANSTNEIQDLSGSGATLSGYQISLSSDGTPVTLPNEADGSTTNELQNLSKSKTGNNVTVNISNGTGTTFSVADADSSATNEIQTLSIDSTATTYDIEISGGNRIHFNKGTTTGINYQPAQSITYNATPEFDFTAGNNGIIQLSGDITAFTFSKVPDGAFGSIVVVQDGTGGWDISSFLTDSAQVTVMVEQPESTTPGATDITGVRDSLAMVFDSIADIQVSIAGLLDSIAVLRDSVADLRTDINSLQGAVAGLSYTTTNITVPSVDGDAVGNILSDFNCGYTSSAIGDLVYLDSNNTWQKADKGTSVATYSGFLGIALEVKTSGNALKVAINGSFVYTTAFPALTIGSPVYMGDNGTIVVTMPTEADHAIRIIGWAVHADKIWFQPSTDYIIYQ